MQGVKNVSVGGLVCQVVSLPVQMSTPEQLEEYLDPIPLLHAYGRIAVEGGATSEIRLLAALKLLFYCAGGITEVLERTSEGYRTLVSHQGGRWFGVSGEPIERIA